MTTEEQLDKYKTIFDLSPEAIVVLDMKGKLIDSNNRISDWTGFAVKDIIGKNILSLPFFSKASKLKAMGNFAKRLMGQDIPPYELEFISTKGEITMGRIIATLLRDKNGKVIGDLVLASNITEETRLAKESKERAEQLESMNKLMVGRELQMLKLKEELQKLKNK